jgi:hypothetical protein
MVKGDLTIYPYLLLNQQDSRSWSLLSLFSFFIFSQKRKGFGRKFESDLRVLGELVQHKQAVILD